MATPRGRPSGALRRQPSPRLDDTDSPLQLWRSLFFQRFAPSRLRDGFLPSPTASQRTSVIAEDGSHTWKALYRISANWRNGRAKSATVRLRESVLDDRLPLELDTPTAVEDQGQGSSSSRTSRTETIVQFSGPLLFAASRSPTPGCVPRIQVHWTTADGDAEHVGVIAPTISDGLVGAAITEMRIDEAPSTKGCIRLAVFYSTGQFAIFRISTLFAVRELYMSSSRTMPAPQFAPGSAAIARFHFPLLVTCSTDFVLGFYILRPRSDDAADRLDISRAQPSMRSQMCWWPLVVSLSRLSDRSKREDTLHFKATVAYSTPFYPSAWTIAVQEFDVRIPASSDPTSPPVATLTARHATALPPSMAHYSPTNASKRARLRRFGPDWSVTDEAASSSLPSSLVTGLEHSAPFVVVSRADNTLDVFEIVDSQDGSDARAGGLSVVHRRTLFGHTGAVGAVAVDGGRCVSGGEDGVKVWELDRVREEVEVQDSGGKGEGVSVRLSSPELDDRSEGFMALATPPRRGAEAAGAEQRGRLRRSSSIRWVGFDGEKIVQVDKDMDAQAGGAETVHVLSFA